MEYTGTIANNSALLWGNDGASVAAWSTLDIPSGYKRLSREWKFEENNSDLGTTIVRYASGVLPTTITGNLIMFVDSDGAFVS